MLTPRETSPLPEAQRVEPIMLHHTGQGAQHTTNWAILAHLYTMTALMILYVLPHWDRSSGSNFLSHPVSLLTVGQHVSVLTLQRQVPDRVATGVRTFKSLVWLDLEKDPRGKRESNPGLLSSRRTPYHLAQGVVCWTIKETNTSTLLRHRICTTTGKCMLFSLHL